MSTEAALLRAVSWNVWWRFGGDWREREPAIVRRLQDLQPDVVGLQEVWATRSTTQADVVADQLGMHAAFAAPSLPPPPDPPETPDQAGVALGVGVLSRWPLADVRRHRLPAAHRSDPPVALHATIAHPAGPLHVIVSCVEWEPEFADDHLAQTRALTDLLMDPSLDGALPVLLLADLNAPPESDEVAALLEVMTDTWIAGSGPADAVTLSSHNPRAPLEARRQIDQRIDYVLTRPGTADLPPVTVTRALTLHEPIDGVHPSDHSPVVADLRL